MYKQGCYILGWIFLFFQLLSIVGLILLSGNSVTLTCTSLERHYIRCQQTYFKFYGLRSESKPPFRLKGVEVEEYTDTDSDGNKYDAYKLYLDAGSERIDFYKYGRDFESAYADRGRILELIIGIRKPSLTLSRGAKRLEDIF